VRRGGGSAWLSVGWPGLRSAKHGRGNDQGKRLSSCACSPSLGSHHAAPCRHRHLAGPPSPGTPSLAPFSLSCLPSLGATHTLSALLCNTGRALQTVFTPLDTDSVSEPAGNAPLSSPPTIRLARCLLLSGEKKL
jgi:hypothetical protein